MWKRIALAAAVAGLAAGLTLTAVQQMQVAPLIEAGKKDLDFYHARKSELTADPHIVTDRY